MHELMGKLTRLLLFALLAGCLPLAAGAKTSKGAQVRTAQTQLYGKYVFRMRAGKGSGVISSFFTWKEGSELPGALWEELDVEVLGRDNAQTWQSNIITGQGTRVMSPQLHSAASSFADAYHTYSVEWTPTSVRFLVDGQVVRTTTGGQANSVRSPSTLRFDFWAANNPGWSGAWNNNILPIQMFVNWVEYYTWNGAGFDLAWRDDFNSLDTSRWVREAHTFDGNEVDFITENAVVRNGFLVLAMTREGQPTGFTGTPPADGGSVCTPTAITPFLRVNGGAWQQSSSVAINTGNSVQFGPSPTSGGSWSWNGCGTSGSAREQTVAPTATCTATAAFTNSCGASTTQNFSVAVAGSSSSSGGGSSTSSSGGGSCPDIKTGGQSGNLNTTGAYCFRVQSAVNGWGVSNLTGRGISVTVNGTGTAVTSPGAPLPAKGANDFYHFNVSAGGVPWASVYWW